MWVCGEEMKYNFFKNSNPDDVIYKLKKKESYRFIPKYQPVPGTAGKSIYLNSSVIPY
jgi:hypothetical protein